MPRVKVLYDSCESPYLVRLELLSIFGWSVKLHVFLRSDADEELHDHPWSFWSLVIAGAYREVYENSEGHQETRLRLPWSIRYFPATWKHRVVLDFGLPCATLVLTAPASREWGFWRDGQFIHWKQFVSARDC